MTGFHSGAAGEHYAQQDCREGFHFFSSIEKVHNDEPSDDGDCRCRDGASERDHDLLRCRPLPSIYVQE
jgi:hypothetical protein